MSEGIKKFNKGELLCKEGEKEAFMYELVSGSVGVYRDYGKDTQEKLAAVDGGFIGEMGVISEYPRAATVIAESDVEAVLISESEYIQYFKENADKVGAMIDCLCERLRSTDDKYTKACGVIREYLAAEEAKKPKDNVLISAMQNIAALFK